MNNVQVEVDNVFMVQERVLWIFENVQLVKKCVQVLSNQMLLFTVQNALAGEF